MRVILRLFGMAPRGVVHLQNASFWRAHRSELASLGILVQCQWLSCRQASVTEFDASGYWQPVQADEERCDMSFLRLVEDHSGCCILDQLQEA